MVNVSVAMYTVFCYNHKLNVLIIQFRNEAVTWPRIKQAVTAKIQFAN